MLNGGEKAKVKKIVMAIKGEYEEARPIIENEKCYKNQKDVDILTEKCRKIFMWMAHLTTSFINSDTSLSLGFDALQEANRTFSISTGNSKGIEALRCAVDYIPKIQDALINQINKDNDGREKVLKDIMDELGIENPNKKKKGKDKKFSSMSFDDWFNDD